MDACFATPFTPVLSRRALLGGGGVSRRRPPPAHCAPAAVASKDSAAGEIERLTRKLEELRAKKERLRATGGGAAAVTGDSAAAAAAAAAAALGASAAGAPTADTPADAAPAPAPALGRHGEQSRFLSFSTVDGGEHYPRVVALVGGSGGRGPAPDEVAGAPRVGDAAGAGRFALGHVPAGRGCGVVAVPGVGTLAGLRDPVVLQVAAREVGDSLPDEPGARTLLVVERDVADEEFDSYKFYAWDVAGALRIGWRDERPPEGLARCLGRVVCALAEEPVERRKAKSCWEEETEYY